MYHRLGSEEIDVQDSDSEFRIVPKKSLQRDSTIFRVIVRQNFSLFCHSLTVYLFQRWAFNKGRFVNNSEIDTLISKRLSVENKVKLSQLEIVNK